jgi:hypothetical protein
MGRLFETLTKLPDMGNRRYGLLQLGTANVELIRNEHLRLRLACATLLGIDPEALSYEDVEALTMRTLVPISDP